MGCCQCCEYCELTLCFTGILQGEAKVEDLPDLIAKPNLF